MKLKLSLAKFADFCWRFLAFISLSLWNFCQDNSSIEILSTIICIFYAENFKSRNNFCELLKLLYDFLQLFELQLLHNSDQECHFFHKFVLWKKISAITVSFPMQRTFCQKEEFLLIHWNTVEFKLKRVFCWEYILQGRYNFVKTKYIMIKKNHAFYRSISAMR